MPHFAYDDHLINGSKDIFLLKIITKISNNLIVIRMLSPFSLPSGEQYRPVVRFCTSYFSNQLEIGPIAQLVRASA